MLVYDTIFGSKPQIAIELLQEFEPPEGYFLAFSGGKDSVVIKKLAEMAGVKFRAHYSVTTIDPPELTRYIKKHHPDVVRDIPKKSFFEQLIKKGYPTRQQRWCCELLKENKGVGDLVLTGVRAAESSKRAKRKQVEICNRDPRKRYLHPIFDWTDEDVWEFINQHSLPYCELYDQGWHRVGCLFCPMNTKRKEHAERYPSVTRALVRAFEKRYEYCVERGLTSASRFSSGEEMFWYWVNEERSKKVSSHQPELRFFLEE